jgi:gas vesicle protein
VEATIVQNTEKTSKSFGGFALFLTGAAVGAVAGVLLAPESGKETRRKLSDWIKEKRQAGREALAQRKHQVTTAIEAGKKAYAEKKELAGV